MIHHIKRNDIDERKWNNCVKFSPSRLPYAYTWYLDSVADQWDGLVYRDYDAVLPLVWRKRFTISYLYQPLFTQQLGVFAQIDADEKLISDMLDAIPSRFRFIEININYLNAVKHERFEISPRSNLCLDLTGTYDKLHQGYHDNAKRNVQKAAKKNLKVRADLKPEIATEFFKANTGVKIPELGEYDYERLHHLMDAAIGQEAGLMLGVFDEKENLYATGFFIVTDSRIINLLPSIDDEGKEAGAGFYLVDDVIRKYAGSGMTLDFEGSMIPSIARFYKSFGAQEQTYWRLRRNNLPRIIRWMKG